LPSSRIPFASSTFGVEAQSLNAMQCVRLVTGAVRLRYLALQSIICVVK